MTVPPPAGEAARLAAMLDRVTDGFVALDRQWRITHVNRRAAEIVGRPREDLVGRQLRTALPELAGSAFHDACHRALAEQAPAELAEHYPDRGRWLEYRIHPAPDGLSVFFRDVTGRRRAEAGLRAAEERFARAFQASPVAISVTTLREGRVVDANDAYLALVGYGREEVVGRTVADLGLWTDPEDRARLVRMLRAGEPVRSLENRFRHRSGDIRVALTSVERIELAGEPCLLALNIDVTERRRGEELSRALAALGAGLAESLDPEAVARRVADGVRALLGTRTAILYRLEAGSGNLVGLAVSGEPWSTTGRPFVLPPGAGAAGLALREQAPVATPDILADPRLVVPAELRAQIVRLGASAVLGVPMLVEGRPVGAVVTADLAGRTFTPEEIGAVRALTDRAALALENARLHAEAERRRREAETLADAVQRQAVELDRRVAERTAELSAANAELNAFAYSVAHDLRQPLRAMRGFAELLLDEHGPRLDAEGQEYARRVAAAAGRMDALTQDLLAYSRLARADLTLGPTAIGTVVAAAVAQVEAAVRAAKAQVSVADPLPAVVGHDGILVQVVANLLDNAVKFVAPGVTPAVRVGAETSAGRVRLWVEDNGIGIAPAHQERVFGVFERLHGGETYTGTGIGLAIVKKAVERMGGRAGVESEPVRGSRFWLDLPAAP